MPEEIIQHNEEMVGDDHPSKADTLSRALLIEHGDDGTHIHSHGELYEWNTAGSEIVIASAGTFYQWVTSTVGLTSGVGFVVGSASTDNLIIGASGDGDYKCSYSAGFSASSGSQLKFGIFKNGTRQDNLSFLRNMPEAATMSPSSYILNAGTLNTGTIASVERADGDDLIFDETNGATPGFDVEYVFTDVGSPPHHFHFLGWYTGSAGHDVEAKIWNYDTSAWDDLRAATRDFPEDTTYYTREFGVGGTPSDYISSGTVKFQIYHTSTGSPGHQIRTGKLELHQQDSDLMVADNGLISLVSTDTIDLRVTGSESGQIVTIYNAGIELDRIRKT